MKKIVIFLLFTLILGCVKEDISPPCTGGCTSFTWIPQVKDPNGYYHYDLVNNFTYFPLYIEATDVEDKYKYNGVSAIEAWSDTDTYWILGDSIMVVIPLYNPFGGLRSSPYWTSTPLAIGHKTVYLSQFAGMLVPVVQQSARVYFSHYEENVYGYTSEYKPQEGNLWAKRLVGPIPKSLEGDTIQIYNKIIWEAGTKVEIQLLTTKIILE